MFNKYFFRKAFIYVLGLFVIALGVNLSIAVPLGVAPVNSLPYTVSMISGIDIGVCVTIVFTIFVFLQFLVLRKDFKIVSCLQILSSIIFGYLVNLTSILIANVQFPDNYFIELFVVIISALLVGLGVYLYIYTGFIPLSTEGLAAAIVQKTGFKFGNAKILIDTSFATISIILSLVFLHGFYGIREGTIITALLVGTFIKFFTSQLDKPLGKFMDVHR
ncbi:MAG: hypothetical protein R3Y33_04430 [Clostridia bacterium]